MTQKFSRRDLGKMAIAGIPLAAIAPKSPGLLAAAKQNSLIDGVQLGAQTYSFRDLTGGVDPVLAALVAVGLSSCELYSPEIEPPKPPASDAAAKQKQRDDLRQWRLTTPMSYFEGVRRKFTDAGIDIYAYNYSFADDFTDAEIDRCFDMAKALGARFITSSSSVTTARRVVPFAEKRQFRVAWHGHSSKDPDQVASTQSFLTVLGLTKYYWANLDIGHYVAWGGDPVAFIKDHHARISNLHLKDRKKNEGPNTEWGQGDTPICDVLELLKSTKWPIPAYIEYEYHGTGTSTEEVAKCYAFAKKCLGA